MTFLKTLVEPLLTVNPVNKDNMNYTSAAIGLIGLISLVTWVTTGRKNFTGPNIDAETEVSEAGSTEILEKTEFSLVKETPTA